MQTALTIAGSDSSGGAGIQADLKTFAAFGVYGTSAITAVTAQSTLGITAAMPLPADMVTAQIEAIAGDIALHATKIGMLATAAIVEAVAAAIEELDLPMVVLDPVLASSSGTRLLDDDGLQMLRAELLPRAFIVTPNLPEAEVLSGKRVVSAADAREAARRIHDMGAVTVIVTGGHRGGEDIVDLLFDGRTFTELHTARVDARNTHGTGCTFASAVAACLALGETPPEAVVRAQRYVAGAIRHAPEIGRGRGPLDHFWSGILKG
jgi:hydroxymethylpyrimidine/phosphomethylpyrimidine kinase